MKLPLLSFAAVSACCFFPLAQAQDQPISQNPNSDLQDPPVVTSLPARARGSGGGCNFGGPFLYVPSKTADPQGLLVRVSPPSKGRYLEGAPIAVHMLSAVPRVNGSIACLSEQGFIDVGFLCPGGQYKSLDGTVMKSGGSAFPPDPQRCVEPLADVIAFATGKTRSVDGKSIQDYAGSVKVLTDNTGVIGWSLGGDLAVLAMARYGDRFSNLKWYASWESRILPGLEDAGAVAEPNPFYNAKTGKIDFDRLRYSPEMPIWVWPPFQPVAPGWPHGGLYLDGDGNGVFNKDRDFAFFAEIGGPLKFFYSPQVTREATQRRVFGREWPKHIATLAEVEERAAREDPLRHIPAAAKTFPSLSVLVFESEQHHVADAADHHAVAQVNAWIDAGARWVRFNPDAHYVEAMMEKKPTQSIQFPAGKRLQRETIRNFLEPKDSSGGPTDKQAMTAAVCELADRTYRNEWAPVLERVLVPQK